MDIVFQATAYKNQFTWNRGKDAMQKNQRSDEMKKLP